MIISRRRRRRLEYNFVFVCKYMSFPLASFNTLALSPGKSQAVYSRQEHRYEVQLVYSISPQQP